MFNSQFKKKGLIVIIALLFAVCVGIFAVSHVQYSASAVDSAETPVVDEESSTVYFTYGHTYSIGGSEYIIANSSAYSDGDSVNLLDFYNALTCFSNVSEWSGDFQDIWINVTQFTPAVLRDVSDLFLSGVNYSSAKIQYAGTYDITVADGQFGSVSYTYHIEVALQKIQLSDFIDFLMFSNFASDPNTASALLGELTPIYNLDGSWNIVKDRNTAVNESKIITNSYCYNLNTANLVSQTTMYLKINGESFTGVDYSRSTLKVGVVNYNITSTNDDRGFLDSGKHSTTFTVSLSDTYNCMLDWDNADDSSLTDEYKGISIEKSSQTDNTFTLKKDWYIIDEGNAFVGNRVSGKDYFPIMINNKPTDTITYNESFDVNQPKITTNGTGEGSSEARDMLIYFSIDYVPEGSNNKVEIKAHGESEDYLDADDKIENTLAYYINSSMPAGQYTLTLYGEEESNPTGKYITSEYTFRVLPKAFDGSDLQTIKDQVEVADVNELESVLSLGSLETDRMRGGDSSINYWVPENADVDAYFDTQVTVLYNLKGWSGSIYITAEDMIESLSEMQSGELTFYYSVSAKNYVTLGGSGAADRTYYSFKATWVSSNNGWRLVPTMRSWAYGTFDIDVNIITYDLLINDNISVYFRIGTRTGNSGNYNYNWIPVYSADSGLPDGMPEGITTAWFQVTDGKVDETVASALNALGAGTYYLGCYVTGNDEGVLAFEQEVCSYVIVDKLTNRWVVGEEPYLSGWTYYEFNEEINFKAGKDLLNGTITYELSGGTLEAPITFTTTNGEIDEVDDDELGFYDLISRDAGTYTFRAYRNSTEPDNYTDLTSQVLTITIAKATDQWTTNPAIKDWEYGKFDESLFTAGRANLAREEVKYSVRRYTDGELGNSDLEGLSNVYSQTLLTGLETLGVGSYQLTVTATGGNNYNQLVTRIRFNITKATYTWGLALGFNSHNWFWGDFENPEKLEELKGYDILTVTATHMLPNETYVIAYESENVDTGARSSVYKVNVSVSVSGEHTRNAEEQAALIEFFQTLPAGTYRIHVTFEESDDYASFSDLSSVTVRNADFKWDTGNRPENTSWTYGDDDVDNKIIEPVARNVKGQTIDFSYSLIINDSTNPIGYSTFEELKSDLIEFGAGEYHITVAAISRDTGDADYQYNIANYNPFSLTYTITISEAENYWVDGNGYKVDETDINGYYPVEYRYRVRLVTTIEIYSAKFGGKASLYATDNFNVDPINKDPVAFEDWADSLNSQDYIIYMVVKGSQDKNGASQYGDLVFEINLHITGTASSWENQDNLDGSANKVDDESSAYELTFSSNSNALFADVIIPNSDVNGSADYIIYFYGYDIDVPSELTSDYVISDSSLTGLSRGGSSTVLNWLKLNYVEFACGTYVIKAHYQANRTGFEPLDYTVTITINRITLDLVGEDNQEFNIPASGNYNDISISNPDWANADSVGKPALTITVVDPNGKEVENEGNLTFSEFINTLPAYSAGKNYTITVFFAGNKYYEPFEKSFNLSIGKNPNNSFLPAQVGDETVDLGTTVHTWTFERGESVYDGIVVPEALFGGDTLTISLNGNPISGCRTTEAFKEYLRTANLAAGRHTLVFSIPDDNNYTGITSRTCFIEIVRKQNSWTTAPRFVGLTPDDDGVYTLPYGTNVIADAATLDGNFTVTYYLVNSTTPHTETGNLSVGKYIAVFSVAETADYATMSSELEFEIVKASTGWSSEPDVAGWTWGGYNEKDNRFTAIPVSGGKVSFEIIYNDDGKGTAVKRFVVDSNGKPVGYYDIAVDAINEIDIITALNTLPAGSYILRTYVEATGNYEATIYDESTFTVAMAKNSWSTLPHIVSWAYTGEFGSSNKPEAVPEYGTAVIVITNAAGDVFYRATYDSENGYVSSKDILDSAEDALYTLTVSVEGKENCYSALPEVSMLFVVYLEGTGDNFWTTNPTIRGWTADFDENGDATYEMPDAVAFHGKVYFEFFNVADPENPVLVDDSYDVDNDGIYDVVEIDTSAYAQVFYIPTAPGTYKMLAYAVVAGVDGEEDDVLTSSDFIFTIKPRENSWNTDIPLLADTLYLGDKKTAGWGVPYAEAKLSSANEIRYEFYYYNDDGTRTSLGDKCPTDPGKYYVSAYASARYSDVIEYSKSFEVKLSTNRWVNDTSPTIDNWSEEFNDSSPDPVGAVEGDKEIKYTYVDLDTGKELEGKPTKAGHYRLYATVEEEGYETLSTYWDFTIEPAFDTSLVLICTILAFIGCGLAVVAIIFAIRRNREN